MDRVRAQTPVGPVGLSNAAIAALYQGKKIEAIKIVREETGIGLKEAKDAVEDYVRNQPALQSSFASTLTQTKLSALLWLLVLIALAVLTYHILSKP